MGSSTIPLRIPEETSGHKLSFSTQLVHKGEWNGTLSGELSLETIITEGALNLTPEGGGEAENPAVQLKKSSVFGLNTFADQQYLSKGKVDMSDVAAVKAARIAAAKEWRQMSAADKAEFMAGAVELTSVVVHERD